MPDEASARLGSERIQGFSDGVFALAATLLVVTLEVPADYDDLIEVLGRFPAFGLAFAALLSLWAGHRQFFGRYPLGDGWTVAINSVLLFVVLVYVYPLKLLAEVLAHRVGWASATEVAEMDGAQTRGLYLVFGVAVVATSLVMAALYLRAWQSRRQLGLGPRGVRELVSTGSSYVAVALIAVVGLGFAAADVGLGWGLPIWLLIVGSPVVELVRHRRARRATGHPPRS